MRIAPALVLAALLASTSQASELVDNYDIIDAESGVSEFTRDIASALNRLQSTRLLLSVERDILGKTQDRPRSETRLTIRRVSRCYIWLHRYAKMENMDKQAEAYALLADANEGLASGALSTEQFGDLHRRANLARSQEPEIDVDKLEDSDATREQILYFAVQYASGLWNAMGQRVEYEEALAGR